MEYLEGEKLVIPIAFYTVWGPLAVKLPQCYNFFFFRTETLMVP